MLYLPDYVEYQHVPAPPQRSLFPMASEDALDLLSKMFTYDPKARISVQQALEHRCVAMITIQLGDILFTSGSFLSSIFAYTDTFHLHHWLQIQINSLDLHLSVNLGFQTLTHMMVQLYYRLQESPGE